MSSSGFKETQDHQQSPPGKLPAVDLVVDEESDVFKFVRDAYATGRRLDLTNMTDLELAEYIAGQA